MLAIKVGRACHSGFHVRFGMIKAFGAPIDEADATAIAEYLAKNYGT